MSAKTKEIYATGFGQAYCGDSLDIMRNLPKASVDLVITSPPYALRRKKAYGNKPQEDYIEWFKPYAKEVRRVLKPRGSFVIEIGGAWQQGKPLRSLYHFELLISLCRPNGNFELAQEFYWYNPARMPSPAQWVTIDRVRVKDAVTPIWWLTKSVKPKASNRRVLVPYKESMERLLRRGSYNEGLRPSGHVVNGNWSKRQDGAIPSNLIIAANTRSSDAYLRGCKEHGLILNPARFVEAVPEFFIKFLTVPGNTILDPFAGSNTTGAVAERLGRKWLSVDTDLSYVVGSAFRFDGCGEKTYRKYKNRLKHKNC